MNSVPKIHAIILALNEEAFIKAQLDTIYKFCHRISVITQFDRDWYGKAVVPDLTAKIVMDYHDPSGKINLVIRRLPDEAPARNMEMLSFNKKASAGILSHGREMSDINDFHYPPDYFWIIDADEIYDVETLPRIISYLGTKKPRGMRITGYNYLRTWNRRVPRNIIDFTHFGFLKPGVLFEQRRVVSWNEFRFAKALKKLRLPDVSARLYGFITCPESIGVFHHACWIGDNERIQSKFGKSSHKESQDWEPSSVDKIESVYVSKAELPVNIQQAQWPAYFFEDK